MKRKELKKLMKSKETERIIKWLISNNIKYDRCDEHIYIKACAVGDNFYDYGETPKPIIFDKEFEWMADDPRIIVYECCECYGCAGW